MQQMHWMKPLPQMISRCLGWINRRVSSQTHFFHFCLQTTFLLQKVLAHSCSLLLCPTPSGSPCHSLSHSAALFHCTFQKNFFLRVYISGYILSGCQDVIITHPGLCEIRTTLCIFHHHMFIECKLQVTPGASPLQPSQRTWPCTETWGKIASES